MSRTGRRLARKFQIQDGEGGRVALAGTAYFLVFGGSIIGRNARDSLFIKNFGVENLPYMYIAGALLVVASATAYAALVERTERRRVLALSFAVFCGLLAACWVALLAQPRWFYPILYVVCQAISIVSGMVFWTATEALFDTRQAKRLLPMVAIGSLLGMIACGLATPPLVRLLGSANLFLVWAAMLAATFALLRVAIRRYSVPAAATATSGARAARRAGWITDLAQGFRDIASTRLLRAMGAIALANTVVFALVDFQFSQVMSETYKTQDELTGFFGTFRGISGFLALLIQLAATPWLIATFGVGLTITIEPALLLASSLGMMVSLNYGTAYSARFLENTLFCTVQASSYQLLYNPLPLERRPRIRAFLEGYFRPLMTGVTGLLLVVGSQFLTRRQVTLCAVIGAVVWVAASLKVRRGYIEALVENLGTASAVERLSAADALAKLDDAESLGRLAHAIRTAPAESAVPAILLLERFGKPESQDVLVDLLAHPEAQIRATAVAALGRTGHRALLSHLNRLLQDPDPRTRANAVDACVLVEPGAFRGELAQRLDDDSDRVRANALAVLARLRERPAAELLPYLEQMCNSPDAACRASAAYALAWFPPAQAQPLLLRLLEDTAQPRLRALRSLAEVGGAASVPSILRALGRTRTLRREGRRALLAIAQREPDATLRHVIEAMREGGDAAVRIGAHLLGRLSRPEAFGPLVAVLSDETPGHREEALAAVERLAQRHVLPAESRGQIVAFCFNEIERMERNLEQRQLLLLLDADPQVSKWLAAEIAGENGWLRRRVLRAAALLHDAARVREVARALDDADARKRANALEALEYVVPGGAGRRLAQHLERESRGDSSLSVLRRPRDVLPDLLAHRYAAFRAAAALLAGRGRIAECAPLVEKNLMDPVPMVREAAAWAARRLAGRTAGGNAAPPAFHPTAPKTGAAGTPASAEVSMLLTVEKVLFLKSVPLFSSLEGEQLAGLAEITEEIEVEPDQVIFQAGESGDELYVIASGRLKVYRGQPGSEVTLAELGERECFGEMALLNAEPRSASVATLDRARLLKIKGEDFRELLFERPQISLEILRILGRRLRRMDVEMEERVRLDSVQQYM